METTIEPEAKAREGPSRRMSTRMNKIKKEETPATAQVGSEEGLERAVPLKMRRQLTLKEMHNETIQVGLL